jgi:predicted phage gp36 major capsid-like protein
MNDERLNEVATEVADTAEKLDEVLSDPPVAEAEVETVTVTKEEFDAAVGYAVEDKLQDVLRSQKAPAFIKRAGLSKPRRLVSRAGRIYDKDRD